MGTRSFLRDRRGGAAVEMALIAPILAAALVLMLDLGMTERPARRF